MISFLQMSLWSAVLTAVILAVRAVFGKRLPKKTFRILWAVVILRMLVPVSLPIMKINTVITVPPLSETDLTQDTVVYTYVSGELSNTEPIDELLTGTAYEVSETPGTDLPVYGIWFFTAAVIFAAFAAVHIKFRLKVRDAIPAEISFETGLKRRVRIKVSDKIASPLTYGIFRPVILLPKNTFICGEKTVEYILSHELAHIKRFDVLYKLFAVLAASLHWFNPLAWVMLAAADRDIELSCDEEVIFGSSGSREEYALTLIEMEEKRSFGVLLSGFGGSSVKERIKAVMTAKRASSAGKISAALLVALAFAVFTVYDIDTAGYSVAVTAAEKGAEEIYAYYYDPLNEGTYEESNTSYADEFEGLPFTVEQIDRALNSYEITVEEAPAAYSEVEISSAAETFDYVYTITDPLTGGMEARTYSDEYSIYNYGYSDALTGELLIIKIDLNDYSPLDREKYGLTVSPDKGYYLYNGTPVAGLQCEENTLVDNIAMKDGGGFFIYKDGGMVQVNTAQFFDVTGMH